MRAMQAPISRFANKKKSRVKMARLFYAKKQKHLKNQNNNVKIYL